MRLVTVGKILGGSLLGVATLGTAVMGYAHTQSGRPLLMWMGKSLGMKSARGAAKSGGACPLGYDRVASPEERESGRRAFASQHAGAEAAKNRAALGFELGLTKRYQVRLWAMEHGVACDEASRSGHDLECNDVSSHALPRETGTLGVQTLWLDFDAERRLVAATTVRRGADVDAVTQTFALLSNALNHDVGEATRREGDASSATLAHGLLRQASAEWRYRDYYALTRETNMGTAYVITEEYQSLQ